MSKLQTVLFVIFLGLGPVGYAQTGHEEKSVDGPRPKAEESVERNLASQPPSDPNKMVESISSANQQLRGLFELPKRLERMLLLRLLRRCPPLTTHFQIDNITKAESRYFYRA